MVAHNNIHHSSTAHVHSYYCGQAGSAFPMGATAAPQIPRRRLGPMVVVVANPGTRNRMVGCCHHFYFHRIFRHDRGNEQRI